MKTHWKKMQNYDYLGSYSLPDGKDITLTIKDTKKEMVTGTGGQKQQCFVCYFQEDAKPMILNRTNCKTIESLYSPYIEDWTGKKVVIGSDKVKAFGEEVDALRIRLITPDAKLPKLTPSHPKWKDAVEFMSKDGSKISQILKHWDISEADQEKMKNEAI